MSGFVKFLEMGCCCSIFQHAVSPSICKPLRVNESGGARDCLCSFL